MRQRKLDNILYRCEACFPQNFEESAIDVWHEALAEFDINEISAAFTIYIKETKRPFLPIVGQIIAIIRDNRGPQLSIESRAQAEWRKVILAVRQRGQTKGAPNFKDPITNHLIQTQFNWIHLNEMRTDNENWYERRWCEAFALASEIDLNQLQIETAAKVKKLAQDIFK